MCKTIRCTSISIFLLNYYNCYSLGAANRVQEKESLKKVYNTNHRAGQLGDTGPPQPMEENNKKKKMTLGRVVSGENATMGGRGTGSPRPGRRR
jgi:hypothetical protein